MQKGGVDKWVLNSVIVFQLQAIKMQAEGNTWFSLYDFNGLLRSLKISICLSALLNQVFLRCESKMMEYSELFGCSHRHELTAT